MPSSSLPAADCALSHCCLWRKLCPPQTPLVGPGKEYASMALDVDDWPVRSVLLGTMATSKGDRSLRLHRFRVAHSGRVLGRSGDALEILGDGYYKAKSPTSHIRAATATRSPDGRKLSLCFFSREVNFSDPKVSKIAPPVPLQLHMDLSADGDKGITVSPLPALPPELDPLVPTCPISAAGDLWAPYLTEVYGPSHLVMQRFDKDAGMWVKVGTLELNRPPLGADMLNDTIPVLQGHVVVGDTILLSLWPFNLFYTFNCSTHAWATVVTGQADWMYSPIRERGIYVEEDDTIYFLSGTVVFAYKLCKDKDQYHMAPPTWVGRVCPFSHEGYGFLSYLGDRVICCVWISIKITCNCDTKHVLITTFQVNGDGNECFIPKGVKVLHSTCRGLDMPLGKLCESYLEFSFLQEYEELNNRSEMLTTKMWGVLSMQPENMEVPASSCVKSSSMPTCCREFLKETPFLTTVMLERSAIKTNITLSMICQCASYSSVHMITILDGRLTCHDKTLTPQCIMNMSMPDFKDDTSNQFHRPWNFVCDKTGIYAVPSIGNNIYAYLDEENYSCTTPWPNGVEFRLVVQVGFKIVAISDTLQDVYHFFEGVWTRHNTAGAPGLDRKIKLSGYVVLSSYTFLVSDAESDCFFLHDIHFDRWSIVKPIVQSDHLPSNQPLTACLSERCVFAYGFIYTCSAGGLAAYELIEVDGSYYYGEHVGLQFSWCKCWERERMCLEYVGYDTSSGAIMFCVMTDDQICEPPFDKIPVRITTVQVKGEQMSNGKLKPKTIGHVDIGTVFVPWDGDGPFWIRNCFNMLY